LCGARCGADDDTDHRPKSKKIAPGDKPAADGTIPGLRLEPGNTKGQGKWILRFVSPVTKKRRDMGLGTYPEVGIADARIRGMAACQSIASGKDPIGERDADRATRKSIAEACLGQERILTTIHDLARARKQSWLNSPGV
jgi:hypothetical protein